ncbi:leucyl aminopeptidase [Synechococcus sp. PROS-U-1]|uniref:leucyl aminopeptidase n=1 Tax=Synechococcus sp. PROS-U-1 TaxID=1400866 RepID=UPI001649564E|nr:leucyl aminopeptidase [Synechococcus sp. PROS-U-1]QNJ04143.1 leucine aminopeptidase [Synechococcus sp. PROS-U-1]
MRFSLSSSGLQEWNGDVLAVGLPQGDANDTATALEQRFAGITETLKQQEFKGKPGDQLVITPLGAGLQRLVVLGLGDTDAIDTDSLRGAAARAAKAAIGCEGSLGLLLPWAGTDAAEAARISAEAVRLCLYKDQRFRKDADPRRIPEALDLIGLDPAAVSGFAAVNATCAGVELARELVAAPPNVVTPAALAETAAGIASDHGLELKVLERSDCEAKGMGAFLAVSQGSDLPPKFIHLIYRPAGEVKRRIALVGKGLTFDSGGYNLKVGAAQIDMMKFDMGGSAAVLGAMRSIAELKPSDVEVHMVVASCENMVNGSAVHPGDIVTAANGMTIEINNTDAEGRLTLADALLYACEQEPDAVVDLATLTGACVIALGDEMAGLWSNNDDLAEALDAAAQTGGEGLWRMPLRQSYKDGLKSLLADMKNTGPRPGGSITAALFLKEFVAKDTAWAHIDIAGPVWSDKGKGVNPAGATGYGVRTLVNWVLAQS